MFPTLSRRQALAGSAGFALLAGLPSVARAEENGHAEALAAFTGGAEPQPGRVALDLPEVAENGNTVPLALRVESPMTAEDHVAAVMILATRNPNPGVATFHFTPLSGRAEASTRIRLMESQEVLAVARMSDGSCWIDRREVRVTVGGCVG